MNEIFPAVLYALNSQATKFIAILNKLKVPKSSFENLDEKDERMNGTIQFLAFYLLYLAYQARDNFYLVPKPAALFMSKQMWETMTKNLSYQSLNESRKSSSKYA